jgi:hypothetical protein
LGGASRRLINEAAHVIGHEPPEAGRGLGSWGGNSLKATCKIYGISPPWRQTALHQPRGNSTPKSVTRPSSSSKGVSVGPVMRFGLDPPSAARALGPSFLAENKKGPNERGLVCRSKPVIPERGVSGRRPDIRALCNVITSSRAKQRLRIKKAPSMTDGAKGYDEQDLGPPQGRCNVITSRGESK